MRLVLNPAAVPVIKRMAAPAVRLKADEIRDIAEMLAPIESEAEFARDPDDPDHIPGALKASLHVEEQQDGSARVIAGTGHWLFMEYGTIYVTPRSFLRPALHAVAEA